MWSTSAMLLTTLLGIVIGLVIAMYVYGKQLTACENFIINLHHYHRVSSPSNHVMLKFCASELPGRVSKEVEEYLFDLKLFPEEKQESEGEKLEEEKEEE